MVARRRSRITRFSVNCRQFPVNDGAAAKGGPTPIFWPLQPFGPLAFSIEITTCQQTPRSFPTDSYGSLRSPPAYACTNFQHPPRQPHCCQSPRGKFMTTAPNNTVIFAVLL